MAEVHPGHQLTGPKEEEEEEEEEDLRLNPAAVPSQHITCLCALCSCLLKM
jgi:hypothetical protein